MNSAYDPSQTVSFQPSIYGDGVLSYPWDCPDDKGKPEMSEPKQVDPTYGYGPRESADETRQAQQAVANDAPVDVNPNAAVARSQVLTYDLAGKGFAAAQERRQGLFDIIAARIAGTNG